MKRTYQPSKRKRKRTNTVLENVWLLLTEEKSLLEEEQKEEKNYLYLQN
jgi:hypothetical protein